MKNLLCLHFRMAQTVPFILVSPLTLKDASSNTSLVLTKIAIPLNVGQSYLKFYAEFTEPSQAIETEKQIKKWSKAKKIALVNNQIENLKNLAKKKF
jgi:hypothetical protein